MRDWIRAALVATVTLLTAAGHVPAAMAAYPEKPITMIVGFRAGGGLDVFARLLAQRLERELGKTVVVDSKPGAGGGVAATHVKGAAPDGYTLGFAVATTFAFDPLGGKLQYDIPDFDYIAGTHAYRDIFIASADSPLQSWAQMLAVAKKRGRLNYASVIPLDRMIMEYIGRQEGLQINIVPTKGGEGARQAVLGGHVDLAYSGANGLALATEGKLRVLAVAGTERVAEAPDAPTLKELGYDVMSANHSVLFGPKGLPAPVASRLADVLRKITADPEIDKFIRDRLFAKPKFLALAEMRGELQAQRASYAALKTRLSQ